MRVSSKSLMQIKDQTYQAQMECIMEHRRYCVINHPLIPKDKLYEVFGIMMRGR